jgi:predicted dehydrogenase
VVVRVACIGAGFIAARHLGNLKSMEDVELVGVADPANGRAAEYAHRYGGRPYEDWRAMLQTERPDAVYLCVPPYVHGDIEETLIDARIPFFVEKPLATDPQLPERLGERIEATGVLTSVGYHWRYLDTVERASALVAARRPRLALGYWLDFVPSPPWWIRRCYSGGQVVDQTTHIYDLARYLLGEPTLVYSAACGDGLTRYPGCDIDSVCATTLQFETGALGVITSTCLVHYPHRIGLWLYAQDLIVACCEHSLRIETPAGEEVHEPQADPYLLEDRAFIRAVQTGDRGSIRVPYAEALRTHRLIMRVLEATRQGRPLALTPDGQAS